ncbi:MAG: HAMP domain-containing sensor histidine kinase [Candidatus Pacebacteria bacterium]|nr:HAMP domain-containing sensor histidine kinase [Candidatus Paceibacterota bacterium]
MLSEEQAGIYCHDIKNFLMSLEFATLLKEDGFRVDDMDHIIDQKKKALNILDSGTFQIKEEINFIISTIEIILKESDENEAELRKMLKSCQGIKRVLARETVPKPKQFVLEQILNELRVTTQAEILSDGSLLVFESDCLFPQTVCNLMENSIFHGGATEIRTQVKKVTKEGISYVAIIIEDNGKGISKKVKGKIFRKGITTRDTGKGGDGLYLVRKILKLSGILIRETSKLGSGARFEILIPHHNIIYSNT